MEEEFFELKAVILKMFAQPTRLKILECLRRGEKSIHEIVHAIHGEQSNISRHISDGRVKSKFPPPPAGGD